MSTARRPSSVPGTLLVLFAVWGVLLTLGLASGKLPQALLPEGKPCVSAATPAATFAACACEKASSVAPVTVTAKEPLAVPMPTREIEAVRYSVCEREEGVPALSRLRLAKEGPQLWALHCGPSVHLIAIEREADLLVPHRVALFRAPVYSPAEAPRAVAVTAADIDGDGRTDLVMPLLLVDRAGVPSGGALFLLRQRAEGGFDSGSRVLDVTPGAAAPIKLDAQTGTGLAVLQLHDAHTARSNELWLVRGGPAPLRVAQQKAGVGASALAVVDLDRDGLDDVAVASASEGRVRIWLSSRGPLAQTEPLQLELAGVRELQVGDLDGDGQRDLVLAGERVWFLLARSAFLPEPKAIAASEGLRDVQLEDANADGKLDVIAYAHPEVVALLQAKALGFERRSLATLHGDLGILFARAAALDDDDHLDLVIAAVSPGPDARVELALARNVSDASPVRLAAAAQTLRDAPLLQRSTLP